MGQGNKLTQSSGCRVLAASHAIEGSSSSGVDRVAAAGQSWHAAQQPELWQRQSRDLRAWATREYDGEYRSTGQSRVLLYMIYETTVIFQ